MFWKHKICTEESCAIVRHGLLRIGHRAEKTYSAGINGSKSQWGKTIQLSLPPTALDTGLQHFCWIHLSLILWRCQVVQWRLSLMRTMGKPSWHPLPRKPIKNKVSFLHGDSQNSLKSHWSERFRHLSYCNQRKYQIVLTRHVSDCSNIGSK